MLGWQLDGRVAGLCPDYLGRVLQEQVYMKPEPKFEHWICGSYNRNLNYNRKSGYGMPKKIMELEADTRY